MKAFCNDCDPCDRCKPACYDPSFSFVVDPFDDNYYNVTLNGKLFRVKAPTLKETDTTLSTNYTNSTLNYAAERHTDIITGNQLGSLIQYGDLRDTKVDYDTSSMCYEAIYRKYGPCSGDGCQSVENAWTTFSIDNEGALQDAIRYVRGANAYGCPVFLDVPDNPNEFWYAGWRTDGQHRQFGYYQARPVDELPKDEDGNTIVLSQDENGEPLVGHIPLECLVNNIMGNLGVDIGSEWSVIEETAGFSATFNNITGEFKIFWSDWNDLNYKQRAGYGEIAGQLVWTNHFDIKTGAQVFDITGLRFDNVKWTKDLGAANNRLYLTVKGVALPNGAETTVINRLNLYQTSINQKLDVYIPCEQTVTLQPGQSLGPFNFVFIHVDWDVDDQGYLGVMFKNRVQGWAQCR